ncbi:SsgA family sporulation/cell division regulator [Streptomyces longisporoflavus]|uniref:SsgA family sporulation/cell division regulator n=1 Tax=Streptomyces longisporoflavus TaxID=28044 RepID=A0ABW7R0P4_9ACTN
MNQPLTSVRCTVTVYVGGPDKPPAPLPAQLHYDLTDPCAVRLSLGAPLTRPVDWVFARSLLAEGRQLPTGIGDVQVTPVNTSRPPRVRLDLRTAAGAAVIEIAATDVTAFLEQSFAVVPPGAESAYIDLDRAVAEVTGQSG